MRQWVKKWALELNSWNKSVHTMVKKIPNSMLRATLSPSVKMKFFLRSFLLCSTMAICWAATDNTGSSILLNSSKQPHEPDWAKPGIEKELYRCKQGAQTISNFYEYLFFGLYTMKSPLANWTILLLLVRSNKRSKPFQRIPWMEYWFHDNDRFIFSESFIKCVLHCDPPL